jgi:hypothetical protein
MVKKPTSLPKSSDILQYIQFSKPNILSDPFSKYIPTMTTNSKKKVGYTN